MLQYSQVTVVTAVTGILGVADSLLSGFKSACGTRGVASSNPDTYIRPASFFGPLPEILVATSILLAPLIVCNSSTTKQHYFVFFPPLLLWIGLLDELESNCGPPTFLSGAYLALTQSLVGVVYFGFNAGVKTEI